MMTFLGIAGYSSAWVEDYAKLSGPLRTMIKETGSGQLHCNLTWTQDGHMAFETIQQRLQEAPALAFPDYSKNFVLYVSTSTRGKFACAVLCQPTGVGMSPQPVSYYSTAFSEVELGLPLCYRALVGVNLMYEKASSITMGYPVTILTHHSLRNLLNRGRLLEQEDVTLARCNTVNPAETLPTLEDGEPHDCVQEAERYSKLRSGDADLELWTDGSCYWIGDRLSAGYAVVRAQDTGFVVEKAEVIPQPASAQLAELGRGFIKTDDSPIQHHAQIVKLLRAMMKPKGIAIAKCAAHKSDMSRVTQGNRAADEAAKAVTELEDKITIKDIILMQEEAGLLVQEAHGRAHVARGEVRRKIIKEYGFWAPFLLEQIDHVIGRCTICLKNNVRRGVVTPPGHIPTPRGPMRELVIDYVDMITPVEGKRYMLVVVDRFSRWVEACPTKRKDAQLVARFL
ncbi:Gag-Pol polyprotein [Merluccius polli]|uniref:Gag-Pol polyprotein n=1 Tax=Merluccius polli TaxID=89951 RepID=A0AA47MQ83_MERPO|nr:Gag-Pol polyprotein [Merluccius polli]